MMVFNMKKILVLFALALLFSGIVGADKLQMDYNVSVYDPLGRPQVNDFFCVNTTLRVNVTTHFTHKGINNAQVTAYLNGTTMVVNTYTNYNGIALVTLRDPGLYRLRIRKENYENVLAGERYNFIVCGSTSSTTTTTTSMTTTTTTIESASTTLPAASTTSTATLAASTTTTIPSESCSDGVKNQDEAGLDCGGICAPCSSLDLISIIIAFFLIVAVCVIVYFLVKGGQKGRGARIAHHKEHEHHTSHEADKK
jgi:hypothetical protein